MTIIQKGLAAATEIFDQLDQEIEKGSIIAENRGFFGLFKTQVKAPLKGKISNISKTTGQIMISEPDIPIEIDAYLDGEIVDIIKDEGVMIQCQGSLVQGIIGVGGEKKGEIILDDNSDIDIKEKVTDLHGSSVSTGTAIAETNMAAEKKI